MTFIDNKRIRVRSSHHSRWHVEAHLSPDEFLPENLIFTIQQIKAVAASLIGFPVGMLEYDHIVSRTPGESDITVVFEFIRAEVEQGSSRVRIEDGTSPEGVLIPHMTALVDLYMADPFGNPVTLEILQKRIGETGISMELVDIAALERALGQVQATGTTIKNHVLAKGRFPGIGKPETLEFVFESNQVDSKMSSSMESTKVSGGDPVCTVSPPTMGRGEGYDIFGEKLSPLRGSPVEIVIAEGVNQDLDGTCYAVSDGVLNITRNKVQRRGPCGYVRNILQVKLVVEPLIVIAGADISELATKDNVEVRGSLQKGTKILSKGRIFVGGQILEGSEIHAHRDIVVSGEINRSRLDSDSSIVVEGNVTGTSLRTQNNVDVQGTLRDSEVSGQSVRVGRVHNSRINAGSRVIINNITGDGGEPTQIKVGIHDFLRGKLKHDRKFIRRTRESLKKVLGLIGPDLVNEIGKKPTGSILLRYIAREKKLGRPPKSEEELDALRKLVESIEPLLYLIHLKKISIEDHRRKLRNAEQGKAVVVIRERLGTALEVEVDGQTGLVEPRDGPLTIGFNSDDSSGKPKITSGSFQVKRTTRREPPDMDNAEG